jgi:hypothetical protein
LYLIRVRRSDLYQRSQSASPTPSVPDPELEAQFRARLASIYGLPSNQIPPIPYAGPLDANGDDKAAEEKPVREFEFRLFASTTPGQSGNDKEGPTQKIILVDEEEDVGDGGFVVQERNRGYYFAEKADGERRQGFVVMALSGEEVVGRARERAWGLEVPWRVRVLKVARRKASEDAAAPVDAVVGIEDENQDAKKKRPGKKRRIILRERKKIREKLQEQKKAEEDKREEAEREKRTRRNREKKVKRKMKEKAKKAGGPVDGSGGGVLVPGESSIVGTDDQVSDQ